MDSRFFWVMTATLVVFIVFGYVFPSQQSSSEGQAAKPVVSESAPVATPASSAAATAAPSAASPEAPAQAVVTGTVTVTTPKYVAVFDEKGGRLTSFQLTSYSKQKLDPQLSNELMDLVTVTKADDRPMRLTISDADAPALENAPFLADQSALEVGLGESAQLTMTFSDPSGLVVKRIFTFNGDNFLVDQKVIFENASALAYDGQVSMRLNTAPFSSKSGRRYDEMAAVINGGRVTASAADAREKLSDFRGKLQSVDWIGYMDQYFLSAMVMADSEDAEPILPSLNAILQDHGGVAVVVSYPLNLAPGKSAVYDFDFYYGPKSNEDLKAAGHKLSKSVDLGWFSFLSTPLAALLRWIYSWVGNYGVAIIIVTVLIKIALWPLTAKSYRSMKEMQKLQPKVMKLREKYADDKETMNREVMQLYKAFKVNPLGGCLPMLLQIPFFIAFYRVLDSLLELRGAPFMLWIQDLAAPDRLGSANFTIPFFEPPTGIPVLTLLMGASMVLQQKMTPNTMGDPTQAKIMMMMPVVFTFILINMPAGLVLYWLVNNILSIGQQKLINRSK